MKNIMKQFLLLLTLSILLINVSYGQDSDDWAYTEAANSKEEVINDKIESSEELDTIDFTSSEYEEANSQDLESF